MMLAYLEKRIEAVLSELDDDALILLPGGHHVYRNLDVDYPFRQNSDFAYLTDWYQPDAWLVVIKNKHEARSILICPDKAPEIERWEGMRATPEAIKTAGHAAAVLTNTAFIAQLPAWLKACRHLYVPFNNTAPIKTLLAQVTGSEQYPRHINVVSNVSSILAKNRLIKAPEEIDCMRQAANISAAAHIKLMQSVKEVTHEYQLSSIFRDHCYQLGCEHLAYESIVASGDNACILHYRTCRDAINPNGLVLVDAGGEWSGYASDITRTFPANGRFSMAQRTIYNMVLRAQQAVIAMIKPGVAFNMLQQEAKKTLQQDLDALGLFKGTEWSVDDVYFHGVSHWLGRDVHDPGPYLNQDGSAVKLLPGMVLTVEPGLYFARHLLGPEDAYAGIGIRIEDDVLVTETGCEVLSAACPKTIEEIEDIMGS